MRADLINAVRSLRAAPSFTVVALVVLTLGIGATTAIFSVVDAVVLRNVPFDEPDRLVRVLDVDQRPDGFVGGHTTAPDYADWAAAQTSFEALAAVGGGGNFTLRDNGYPERLRVNQVTANLFSVLRVRPQLGQLFSASNEVDGNHRVALLSHGFWQRRFNGDPGVVGTTINFDTGAWQIVGVMPEAFEYPIGAARSQDMWVPYVVPESQKQRGNSRNYGLSMIGRLKPGVSVEVAQQEMTAIQKGVQERFPKWNPQRAVKVESLHASLIGRVRGWMLMLLGAVTFVLLIACVNVANLYLARATARTRDVSVRAALGASRWQIARGFLIESLVLCAIGTVLGVVVATWGIAALKSAMPANLPRVRDIGLDARVLLAAACAMVGTAVVCGLAPALQLTRPNLTNALRDGGRANTAGTVKQRLRSLLVMSEVALAVILLVGAGLFLASFARLISIDVGLDYRNVLAVPVYPPFQFSDPAQREAGMARAEQLVPQAIERVSALPGVLKVGAISNGLPLSGSWSRTSVKIPGVDREFDEEDSVDIREVSPSYFDVMQIRLLSGRLLDDRDRTGERVIVLNDVAAKRYFGDRDPLGARISVNGDRTVVGVVASVRLGGPETETRPEAYRPFEPKQMFGADLVIKTAGDPVAAAPAVFAAIRELAPDLILGEVETMEKHYERLIWERRFNAMLLSIFGVLGIVITAVGIYGVMAYVVEQRTQEIGVRMALGAQPSRVLGMMLVRAMTYVGVGLAVGLIGALALSRLVAAFLFQVEPGDPVVYVATGALLVVIGLIAAWVPSRRASKVDPIVALRT